MKDRTLVNITIRGFHPVTSSNTVIPKKKFLLEKLKASIGDRLPLYQKKCKSAGKLSLKACFFLYPREGKYISQDIDNLLKILLDVLQDYMDKQRKHEGLGIISNDECVYHVDCVKKEVSGSDEEGMDVEISSLSG